jgi:AraC-like DNA-binding protein
MALFERLQGLDTAAILERARLDQSRFDVARPTGTTEEFFALWRAVEELNAGEPDLGMRIGVASLPDNENVISLAAMHSPTFGEGLKKLAHYKRLVCPERLSVDIGAAEARVSFEWLLATGAPPDILAEIIFAGILNLARAGTRTPVTPLRLELARAPKNETGLRRHFGCQIRFSTRRDILVFDKATLALPMRHRNVQLLSLIIPGLEQAIADIGRERTFADDVRAALRKTIGDRPAISKLARGFGMSARTLQRRLEGLGTSYQSLLDDVRRQSAHRLLARGDLGIGEVAFLLGFEQTNSFVRAFQGWEGTTPTKWRTRVTREDVHRPSRRRASAPRRASRRPA